MAQVTQTIPDEPLDKIVTAKGWTASLGITRIAFFKRMIAEHTKGMYSQIVQDEAAESARIAAKTIDIS